MSAPSPSDGTIACCLRPNCSLTFDVGQSASLLFFCRADEDNSAGDVDATEFPMHRRRTRQ